MKKSIQKNPRLWAFQYIKTLIIGDKEIAVVLDFCSTILDAYFVNIGNYLLKYVWSRDILNLVGDKGNIL